MGACEHHTCRHAQEGCVWLHNHCRVCYKFVLDRDEYIPLQHLMAASQRAPIGDGNDSVRRRLEHREADPAHFAPSSRAL
jgi:hypothetical protein